MIGIHAAFAVVVAPCVGGAAVFKQVTYDCLPPELDEVAPDHEPLAPAWYGVIALFDFEPVAGNSALVIIDRDEKRSAWFYALAGVVNCIPHGACVVENTPGIHQVKVGQRI